MFETIQKDFERYHSVLPEGSKIKKFFYILFTQEFWAVAVYRYGSWIKTWKIPLISFLCTFIYFFLNKLIEITAGISLSSTARIGKGLYIGHFGCIFINESAVIGENCSIAQGVTVGTLGLGKPGAPTIGNNVFIGAGAKILGNITVGNNARIGANAVVVNNVPDHATAVGIPAQIVKIKTEKI